MQQSGILSVFDFDGTLTRHDSFLPFLRFAFGHRIFAQYMLKMMRPTFHCLCKKITRDELKAILVATFLTDVDEKWIVDKANAYCRLYWRSLMRPSGLIAVADEISSGAEVTLCSASPEIMLAPFAEKLEVSLIGTKLEVVNGRLTGRINGYNCRCAQKIHRLEAVYGPLVTRHIRAWGDSAGDIELLSAANTPHWQYFHRFWQKGKSPLQ
jgi:HAD-superfamily subfamily IB hydrolase, TIGR01490